ncbi:hypothetical protein ACJX0J_019735, partial [Zea mays]
INEEPFASNQIIEIHILVRYAVSEVCLGITLGFFLLVLMWEEKYLDCGYVFWMFDFVKLENFDADAYGIFGFGLAVVFCLYNFPHADANYIYILHTCYQILNSNKPPV